MIKNDKQLVEYMGIKLIGKPEIVTIKDDKYALVNWKNLTSIDKHRIGTKVYRSWSRIVANAIHHGLHCNWDSGYSWVDLECEIYEE